ncbi:hypothetical protein AB6A40_002214 [Gnathostoma spinigerum]|uniref:WASH complex subunit 7 n=1 Tax=Gnathostoma spinigerum TaxID=75299 RepID=A0ABD6E740_9BILA
MVSTIMDEAKRERASAAELRRFSTIVNNLTKFENDTRFSFNPCFFLKSPSRTTEQLPSQIQSGNPIVDKCINVLATLASEVNILDDYAHRHVFPTILLYGEDADQSMQVKGHELVEISEFLPFLQEASMFVSRCNEVFRNILLQLHSVFSSKEDVWKRMRGRSLKGVWNTLGQLLSLLVILDEVIQNQKLVKLHWSSFLRSLSLLQYNPSQFNIDSTRLKSLQTVLTQMDAQLLTGVTFQNCCQQKLGVDFNADSKFVEHLRTVTLAMYETWEKAAAEDLPDQRQLIGILSLAVLHSFLSRAVEKRLIRSIWNSNRKLPFFNIMGNIIWTPCDFLLKSVQSISKVIDSKSISSMRSLRFAVYEQQEASLSNEFTINANNAFLEWQSQMVTSLEHWPNESVREEVSRRISLFLKGVRQADSLCRLLKSIVAGHLCENRPIARSSAINVLHLIEIVMSIKKTFFAWWDEILESCQQAVQQWSSHLLTLVSKIKDSLRSYSEPSYETMDVISMFRVAENALCGAVTVDSLFIVELVLDMAHHTKLFSSTDLKELEEIISRMNSTCDFGRIIARVCDCSFLFWHRALISTYFESLLEDFSANVESFFAALNDVGNMIKMCSHPQREVLLSHFQTDTRKLFEKEFMMKLYSAVENDLRFSLHSSLRVGAGESSASRDISVLHLMKLLQVEPFSLGDEVIDIKRLTELYLERSFYNLTAVALHDSHIYTTMRLIAAKKYGLNLCESSLPFQKLDQGLDVLAVTRELGHFVSKYSYNLNAQFFIEKESKNKQLNVLTVEHIANSIRTHGMGIMNTAINCAYQCLKTKLFTFSQFLYDDQVKGQLIKEARYFRKNSDKLGKKVSYLHLTYLIIKSIRISANVASTKYGAANAMSHHDGSVAHSKDLKRRTYHRMHLSCAVDTMHVYICEQNKAYVLNLV